MKRHPHPDRRTLLLIGVAAGLAACSASSEGGTSVRLVSSGEGVVAGQEMSTANGGRLRLDELFWTTSEIELLACPSAWQRAADWFVARAHAHGTSTPTVLAVPTVESMASASDVVLGQMSPPAGRYCAVRYQLGPADADAEGLADAPDMLGRSLLLRGAFGMAGAELEPFELASGRTLDVELEAELTLSADQRQATLRFAQDPGQMFGELDFASLDGVRRELAVLEALSETLSVRAE
jgi:hypothetical protein